MSMLNYVLAIKQNGEWVDLPFPDYNGGLTRAVYDVDYNSGRDNTGYMHRDRVGVKRKMKCVWSNRRQEEITQIISLLQDVFFELKYTDIDGSIKEGVFYVGDREAPVYTEALGSTIYSSFTANFIER